ncbi:hypothetical protein [Chryseobacterium sp. 5_R23647]|uniref:hypothetical protein n=1 Tax=Chryseobacterium sp. 5_R23647 TaxID=2258964 RepID=UPI000E239BF1|nr:hypothetical protein [Chryseobacterium sp. 5_R23647]REC40932.1 hypothetical protein DRF69_16890 [Chryseobacterium sp. 5_R23647]
MKKIVIIIGILATAILLSLEFYVGYEMGYQHHKDEANGKAKEMILNDEIPNYYIVVGTLDFIINNKSGELEETVKK